MIEPRTFGDFQYDLARRFPGFTPGDDSDINGGDLVEWLSEYIEEPEPEPVPELSTYHIEVYRLNHIWERLRFDVTAADNIEAKVEALKKIEEASEDGWDYELGEVDSIDPPEVQHMEITLKE